MPYERLLRNTVLKFNSFIDTFNIDGGMCQWNDVQKYHKAFSYHVFRIQYSLNLGVCMYMRVFTISNSAASQWGILSAILFTVV